MICFNTGISVSICIYAEKDVYLMLFMSGWDLKCFVNFLFVLFYVADIPKNVYYFPKNTKVIFLVKNKNPHFINLPRMIRICVPIHINQIHRDCESESQDIN